MSVFQEIVRKIMEKKHINRYRFCRKTGMDAPAFYQWLSGKRVFQEPNLELLLKKTIEMNGKPISFHVDKEGNLGAQME